MISGRTAAAIVTVPILLAYLIAALTGYGRTGPAVALPGAEKTALLHDASPTGVNAAPSSVRP